MELDDLLNRIGELQKEYKKEFDFNAFLAIGFRSQEVMHSNFIAKLLDPKGNHRKDDCFLKLFFEKIYLGDFETKCAVVQTERPAGNRWIDIKIAIGDDIIIIENKVWAKDQDRQLSDYYNSCKNNNNRVEIIYLTLDGKSPTKNSLGENLTLNQVKCISYEKHIIPWINECAKGSEGRVKISLEMYSELLHDLINKNIYMSQIFEELKKDEDKLKLAIDISLALKGKNYIKEFPETINFLKERIITIIEDSNPHEDEDGTILNIADEGHEFADWRFYLSDGYVYVHNDDNGNNIDLFNPTDISDEKLRSLIFNEVENVDEWLSKLFDEIRNKIELSKTPI
jgi:hypothetical protein